MHFIVWCATIFKPPARTLVRWREAVGSAQAALGRHRPPLLQIIAVFHTYRVRKKSFKGPHPIYFGIANEKIKCFLYFLEVHWPVGPEQNQFVTGLVCLTCESESLVDFVHGEIVTTWKQKLKKSGA